MIAIRKKIVTDETNQPVAVQIDYEDWLEIEKLLSLQTDKHLLTDLSEFRGVLKMTEDALEYQRRIRAEWDREWDKE
ncbi:MAG TPA: hypothetical protein VFV93_10595 [Thermomicrobiales bacterium]|nr:hypothetical protein [Thermomicrobiales bacterium]